ncbi:MAG: hypothetical protein RMJ86_08790 [Anaerolineae bacterium]|nr:hypothetical protein [Thermoflexales bacterium]MCX7939570.1 hypothetical protein [Thermoflexales bacterium]MDW8054628.1 hypothetical protein [Anaerolineae bacterium]
MSVERMPRKYTRTRFNIALEERPQQRAKGKVRLGGRVLILVVLVCALWMSAQWLLGEAWHIREVRVRNNGGVPVEAIIAASGLLRKHFLAHDAQRAAEAVETLNGVVAAEVACRWNGHAWCEITVQPSRPLALWEGQRRRVWNDAEGYVQVAEGEVNAPLRLRADDAAIPAPATQLPPDLLRALLELSELQPEVKVYDYSAHFGIIWTPDGMQRVRLGVAEYEGAMRDKLRAAQEMLRHVRARGLRPLVIDVRFPDAPYYVP